MAIEDDRLDPLPLFAAEDEAAIRARWEAWANEGLTADDVDEWVDTRPGSHWYINTAQGIREAARIYDLMGTEFVAAGIPIWSWGEYLDAHSESMTITRLAATRASGEITFYGPAGTTVPAGVVVAASGDDGVEGNEWQTTEAGTVQAPLGAPGGLAAVLAAGGALPTGAALYWVVTAVNAEGETVASAQVSLTPTTGNQTANLTWTDKVGATAYRVYRGTASGGPYDFVAEVPGTQESYSDDNDPAPDSTRRPPSADTTGDQVTLAVEALAEGIGGNAAVDAASVLRTVVAGVTSVTNRAPIRGGTEAETDEALLDRLIAAFSGAGPGNQRDYEIWARAYGGVGRVTVVPLWNGAGTVQVIVLDPDGEPVSQDIVDGLQAFLDPTAARGAGEAPVGASVTVSTAAEVTVNVTATVELADGYSLDGANETIALRDAIRDAVAAYIDTAEPGGEVVRQQVVARIAGITGVHDVGHTGATDLLLNGTAANVALTNNPAQVATLGTLTLTEADV